MTHAVTVSFSIIKTASLCHFTYVDMRYSRIKRRTNRQRIENSLLQACFLFFLPDCISIFSWFVLHFTVLISL